MKLPPDSTIAPDKLNKYLLKFQIADDKSKFLKQAGYELGNWQALQNDLKTQILPLQATFVGRRRFGDSFEIRGVLTGPNGNSLRIVSIWMIEHETQRTKFITLFPNKEEDS